MKTNIEREQAIKDLREMLKPGDTIFTIGRHVSSSGMTRHIGVVVNKDGNMLHPNWMVAKAVDYRVNKRCDGLVIGGCGMDMGFHLVYTLGRVLFPNGFDCSGKNCQSNDHSNGDRNYEPHHHTDGGYAFRHTWL